MILPDINLLVYAINEADPNHGVARDWLEKRLSEDVPLAMPWFVILGFIRLSTNPRVVTAPLSKEKALDLVNEWLAQPCVRILHPTETHWEILQNLLDGIPAVPKLIMDAHLAALAFEHNCELCSADKDFAKFPGLRWSNPLSTQSK